MMPKAEASLSGRLLRRLGCGIAAAVLLCLLLLFTPFLSDARALTAREKADLARVDAYLNGFRTMKARFLQISPDGSLARGTLYLKRPGRLRFEYDPPVKLLIVADGLWVNFIDRELDEVTRLPLTATPLKILVAERIELARDTLVSAVRRGAGRLSVTLRDPEEPEQGSLTLEFSEKPLTLRQWSLIDTQGGKTVVAITDQRFNLALKPELFTYFEKERPDQGGR